MLGAVLDGQMLHGHPDVLVDVVNVHDTCCIWLPDESFAPLTLTVNVVDGAKAAVGVNVAVRLGAS